MGFQEMKFPSLLVPWLIFASSGGFCVGVNPMVHHQRISSNAYVFSASLPPYSAKVTSQAIRNSGTRKLGSDHWKIEINGSIA